jgi:hypothetical protein
MTKNLLLGALGVAVVAGLLVFFGSFIGKVQVIQQTPDQNVGGNYTAGPEVCVNNVCTYNFSGDCRDATTTPFAILSPAATSTLTSFQLVGTNGTSTATTDFVVATTTAYYAAGLTGTSTVWGQSAYIMQLTNMAASVKFCGVMGGLVGECPAGTASTKTQITIPPSTYITGYVTSAIPSTITSKTNTFSCSYKGTFRY